MDLMDIILLVVVALLAVGGFFLNKRNPGSAQTLYEVALAGAQMAEQLATGDDPKIERSERNLYAVDYVLKFFPNVDRETILKTIEAAVFVVNTMQAQITTAKAAEAGVLTPYVEVPGIVETTRLSPTKPESSLDLPGGY